MCSILWVVLGCFFADVRNLNTYFTSEILGGFIEGGGRGHV